jgi:hypothetical protein
MSKARVPQIETDETSSLPRARRVWALPGRSFVRIFLEVGLISVGVFLGLMGEQWREDVEHRELAASALRRFQAEIVANRRAVERVTQYNTDTRQRLDAYFASAARDVDTIRFSGLGAVFFDQTAWDLALTTQALAYVDDEELAYALSRAYNLQRTYAAAQAAIVQSTIYGRAFVEGDGYWQLVRAYFGDLGALDPLLLGAYDDVQPMLDRALAH